MASWLSKGCQDHAMVSSTNDGGKTGYPHIKDWGWTSTWNHLPKKKVIKKNWKWINDLNVRAKSIRLFQEDEEISLHNLGFGNGFFNITPKIWATKERSK